MKPDTNELNKALAAAEAMRESGEDPDFISKSLLYLYQRVNKLEKVFNASSQYMHFGQEEHEHAVLLKALESARELEGFEKMEEKENLGI
ncbi:MAG: hypothetical protein GXP13_06070 [Gammaproteobacteria bacterium]|nr:hypothetical protein [Gammaproteobacteria bacterium]